MMRRRVIGFSLWLILTLSAILWITLGNLSPGAVVLMTMLIAVSLAYGPARAIALYRTSGGDPVEPRIVPFRVCLGITGLIMFGPTIAYAAGWDHVLLAGASFLGGLILMSWATAIFSDGYQALFLDALIFHGNLTPPEEDWIKHKR